MKLHQEHEQVTVSGTSENFDFGIQKDGLATIIEIVSNRIYSDKILAVIREYACNALDANKEAGKAKKPIRITLPTQLDPVFKVRDFGKGLSEDEIKEIFVQYGSSTKRSSNKFVGMFGIGSKSGFAYGNAFVVSSYRDGKRLDYSAYMDNKMPKMSLLSEDDTKEENGLEIQIPVKLPDIGHFVEKCRTFFFYWDVKPEFLGTGIIFPNTEVVLEGKGWKINKYAGMYGNRAIAVMGNVPYPVDMNALNIPSGQISQLSKYPITLEFKIGDLGVNAGREGLEYDDRTRDNLVNRLKEIVAIFAEKVKEQFKDCKTMFENKLKFVKVFDNYGPLAEMTQYFDRKEIKFNGVEVTGNYWGNFRNGLKDYSIPDPFSVSTYQASGGYSSGIYKRLYAENRCSKIVAQEDYLYVINDEGAIHGIQNKITPLLECEGTNPLNCLGKKYRIVYLITVTDAALFDKWKADMSFDAPTVNLSSLKKVKLKDVYGVTVDNTAALAAQKTSVFTLDCETQTRRYCPKREYFKASDIDLKTEKGLYIVLDRFFVKVPKDCNLFRKSEGYSESIDPLNVIRLVRDFSGLKYKKGCKVRYPKIYALRERDLEQLGPGMKCFFKTVQPQLTKLIIDPKIVAKKAERDKALQLEGLGGTLRYMKRVSEKLAKGSPFVALFKKQLAMLHENDKDLISSLVDNAEKYGITLPVASCKEDLCAEFNSIMSQYPMLALVGQYNHIEPETVIEYMTQIDELKKLKNTP